MHTNPMTSQEVSLKPPVESKAYKLFEQCIAEMMTLVEASQQKMMVLETQAIDQLSELLAEEKWDRARTFVEGEVKDFERFGQKRENKLEGLHRQCHKGLEKMEETELAEQIDRDLQQYQGQIRQATQKAAKALQSLIPHIEE